MKNALWSRREFLAASAASLLATRIAPLAHAAGESVAPESMFFDAFVEIGPRARKPAAQQWRLEELQAEMQHCSVSGALVSYTLSVDYDPMWSNLELSRMLSRQADLFASWNVMPSASGEFPEPNRLGRSMREHNVRAVALHPVANGWSLKAESSAPLLRWLAQENVLTRMPRGEVPGFDDLAWLLKAYPDLPVLLTGASWTDQRLVLPLLVAHRNLQVTFDHFQIFKGIEYLVTQGCEDQLLFGSHAPMMSMGAHRAYIDYADVPIAIRRKIAGGNLARLLRGERPARIQVNSSEDALMRAVRRGKPLPVPVVDFHIHALDEGLNGAGGLHRMWGGDAAGEFAMGKRLGYAGGALMSWNGTVSADSLGGNATIQRVLDKAPPGYWGAATFDPVHYTQTELAALIPRCYEDRRFIGMKPYMRYGLEYNHRGYDVWWEFGQKHRLYALIHRTRQDFREVEVLAPSYPNIRWVVTHGGMTWGAAEQAVEVMKRFSNVYIEVTYTSVLLGVIDYLVSHAGEDRVLYGSDMSMRDPRQQIGWVVFSRLPVTTKAKILGQNALRVIEPCLARLPAANRPSMVLRRTDGSNARGNV